MTDVMFFNILKVPTSFRSPVAGKHYWPLTQKLSVQYDNVFFLLSFFPLLSLNSVSSFCLFTFFSEKTMFPVREFSITINCLYDCTHCTIWGQPHNTFRRPALSQGLLYKHRHDLVTI